MKLLSDIALTWLILFVAGICVAPHRHEFKGKLIPSSAAYCAWLESDPSTVMCLSPEKYRFYNP